MHRDHAGAGFDTGRAMLARSSFGNPIDTSFYRPDDPGAVPNLVPQRPGYDVVTPMPFYRCNQGDYTHLHMFDEEEANGTIPLPAVRAGAVVQLFCWLHCVRRTAHTHCTLVF